VDSDTEEPVLVAVPVAVPEAEVEDAVVESEATAAMENSPLCAKTLLMFPTSTRAIEYPARAGTTGSVTVNSPNEASTVFAMANWSLKEGFTSSMVKTAGSPAVTVHVIVTWL